MPERSPKSEAQALPSNIGLHIVSGARPNRPLNALAKTGSFMPEQLLSLLRSLIMRPNPTVAPNIKPLLIALRDSGYVTCGADGWIATAEGCELVENRRTVSLAREHHGNGGTLS